MILTALIGAGGAEASLVAPRSSCPAQKNVDASGHDQQKAMLCMVRYARRQAGLHGIGSNHQLERAAGRKARDVLACGLSHTACGVPADHWAQRYGYISSNRSWRWGENLGWGKGDGGTAREILQGWLNSPPHRAALLDSQFDDLGVGMRRGNFGGVSNAAVWVIEFGCRGC